jgi:bifunctional ADP-heptose synthase (sugar kinase/adenylyltransferase)
MIEPKKRLIDDLKHLEILINIVHQFKGVRIAVLGDPMLDYYHFGHVDRMSPEAPGRPIFVEDNLELRDGGAGNVVKNLIALGCAAQPLFPPAPHTIKHRFIVGGHQLFRVDRDRDHSTQTWTPYSDPFGVSESEQMQALVISDYAKGWCTPARCQHVIEEAKARAIPVIVDPKGTDWYKYSGATVICPNQNEMAQQLTVNCQIGHLLWKRGAEGIRLYENWDISAARDFPACAHAVFDVTGAGDTVVAVMAACLAVNAEMAIAAELANIAAGVVVGQVGTYPIHAAELLAAL